MAQVMVNFRLDESVKKNMEQACKEMGMSMTSAFTIFATKVSKEKRIPFEVTVEPQLPEPKPQEETAAPWEKQLKLTWKQQHLESLCTKIRRSLTRIYTAIHPSITGLTMEHIRLLCGDELKDKTAAVSAAGRALFSSRTVKTLQERDLSILDEYLNGLSDIAEDIQEIEHTLVPAMKAWSGGDTACFLPYAQQLDALSQDMDRLQPVLQRFLRSTVRRPGSARFVLAQLQQAAAPVRTEEVRTALEELESLVLQSYGDLENSTKTRLESHYLQTLIRALQELSQAEQSGHDSQEKALLCLRAIHVVSQVIAGGEEARRERTRRSLEAEVSALERLASMRGDVAEDRLEA